MKVHWYISADKPEFGSTLTALCLTLVPNAQPIDPSMTWIGCRTCQELLNEFRPEGVTYFAGIVNGQELKIPGFLKD
jgi:hypothetical protein